MKKDQNDLNVRSLFNFMKLAFKLNLALKLNFKDNYTKTVHKYTTNIDVFRLNILKLLKLKVAFDITYSNSFCGSKFVIVNLLNIILNII